MVTISVVLVMPVQSVALQSVVVVVVVVNDVVVVDVEVVDSVLSIIVAKVGGMVYTEKTDD